MREISVFVDESGDFGEYEKHSPYYIVTMVFHDQSKDIRQDIIKLDALIMSFWLKLLEDLKPISGGIVK